MSKNTNPVPNLRMTVYCALFTALIIVGGYISVPVPIGPVPIVLADFFVMITGLFLGWRHGLACVALYVALGAVGLPVFAGGQAGLAVLFGPTAGFFPGYALAAASIGFLSEKMKPSVAAHVTALVAGNVLLYLCGVPALKFVLNISWTAALEAGLLPFVPGIVIKIAVAAAAGRVLLPQFKQKLTAASTPQEDDGNE